MTNGQKPRKHQKRTSINKRITVWVFFITTLSTLVVGAYSLFMYYSGSVELNGRVARGIAESVSPLVDGDIMRSVLNGGAEDPATEALYRTLDKIKAETGAAYLYVVRPDGAAGVYYYAEGMTAGENPDMIGNTGEWAGADVFCAELFDCYTTGKSTSSGVYNSLNFGIMVSSFAPIRDSDGSVVGVVGADILVEQVISDCIGFGAKLLVFVLLCSVVFSLVTRKYMNWMISYVLNRVTEGTKYLTQGRLDFQARAYNGNDSIGALYVSFAEVIKTFAKLIADMKEMTARHKAGDYDYKMDTSKFEGAYREIVEGVNDITFMYVGNFMSILETAQSYGFGDFEANVAQYPGRLGKGNVIIDELRGNLTRVSGEINGIAEKAINGDLSARANASGAKGDWLKILNNLNTLVDAAAIPMEEAGEVMRDVSSGKLSAAMRGEYKGEFAALKDSINTTVTALKGIVADIKTSLESIADGDLSGGITAEYPGDFTSIKDSINNINEKLNGVIQDIYTAAESVDDGARQISELSGSTAAKVGDQTLTVERMANLITSINEQTGQNAQNAAEAEKLSGTSMKNAETGSREMEKMLAAMEEIKASSNNIASIIKVIDEISFQTNLLALNAAIEAAKAGIHGKGFTVVAEQVRDLAGRSAAAAKETQNLIDDTIEKVGGGMDLAVATNTALEKIVGNTKSVSNLISEISTASKAQTDAVQEVFTGISQISDTTKDNLAATDETAAAASNLTGQAGALTTLLRGFKLRKTKKGKK